MPHCRSAAALALRTDRALTLGYVRVRLHDVTHVAVPASLAKSVKVVAKSMQLHAEHDCKTMTPHYQARLATFGAKDSMNVSEYKHAQSVQKTAARAKHMVGASAVAALSGPSTRSNACWADVEIENVATNAANGGDKGESLPRVEV